MLKIVGCTDYPCFTPLSIPNGRPSIFRNLVPWPSRPSTAVVIYVGSDRGHNPLEYPCISLYIISCRFFVHLAKTGKAVHEPSLRAAGPNSPPWSPFPSPSYV